MCFEITRDPARVALARTFRYGWKVVTKAKRVGGPLRPKNYPNRATYRLGEVTKCDDPGRKFVRHWNDARRADKGIYVWLGAREEVFRKFMGYDSCVLLKVRVKGLRAVAIPDQMLTATYDSVTVVEAYVLDHHFNLRRVTDPDARELARGRR